ncbi:vacuolar protein sorting-associated protein 20 homolog 2-like [Trifolium pratense]|uniref:vacuolar protein sorting-associated protein 20 homolog 2-like n=1 Tax=Trifolium pratense TaxID=57577 RepID=UPI001E694BDD|nr:vacuolar protein sorting-associated protein 20 homolog 2-like [Trifolium pratense]
MIAPPEIYAILGEELSVEDEEEVLAEFENLETQLSSSSIIVLPDFSEDPSLNDSAYSCDGQKLANDTIDYPVKEGLQVELKSLKRKIEAVSADVPCLKNEEFNKLAKF